jgi:PAS domain S-box-containing protein
MNNTTTPFSNFTNTFKGRESFASDEAESVALTVRRLASLIDAQSTYLVRTDMQGNYTFVNKAFAKKYQHLGNLIGLPAVLTMHPDEIGLYNDTVMQCIERPGSVFLIELRKPTEDGGWFTTEWEFMAVTQNHYKRSVVEIQCVGHDITLRKQYEQEIQVLNQRLEEILAERTLALAIVSRHYDELIALIAHQLKNPLTGIRLAAEKIIQTAHTNNPIITHTDTLMEPLFYITDTVHYITKAVNTFIAADKLDYTSMPTFLRSVNVWEVIENVVANNRLMAEHKGITFEDAALSTNQMVEQTQSNTKPPISVTAEYVYLHDAVDNLVSNAIKYSERGGTIRISVHCTEMSDIHSAGVVQIVVEDDGPGISTEDQERLFEKYAILSAKPTGGKHLTGLGLFIVKRLVTAMNGRIWCESELGKGARFIIELPIEQSPTTL